MFFEDIYIRFDGKPQTTFCPICGKNRYALGDDQHDGFYCKEGHYCIASAFNFLEAHIKDNGYRTIVSNGTGTDTIFDIDLPQKLVHGLFIKYTPLARVIFRYDDKKYILIIQRTGDKYNYGKMQAMFSNVSHLFKIIVANE